jgi:DNA-binding transcriptional LysR family regulator
MGMKEADLLKMPLALVGSGEFRSSVEDLMTSARIAATVAYECQSHSQCALLVKEGIAASILPDLAADVMKGYSSIQPTWLRKYKREMALAWRSKTETSAKSRLAKIVEEALVG